MDSTLHFLKSISNLNIPLTCTPQATSGKFCKIKFHTKNYIDVA